MNADRATLFLADPERKNFSPVQHSQQKEEIRIQFGTGIAGLLHNPKRLLIYRMHILIQGLILTTISKAGIEQNQSYVCRYTILINR